MSGCCAVPTRSAKHEIVCPECKQKGKKVSSVTVNSLVKAEFRPRISSQTYFFCETPTCGVVYFSEGAGSSFNKDQLSVRVGLKETVDPIPVCYCFGHTVGSIRDEIEATGKAAAEERIRAEIKAGNCECEIKNPAGACCLGAVRLAVRACLYEIQTPQTRVAAKTVSMAARWLSKISGMWTQAIKASK